MGFISYVADIFGVVGGLYVVVIGLRGKLKERKDDAKSEEE